MLDRVEVSASTRIPLIFVASVNDTWDKRWAYYDLFTVFVEQGFSVHFVAWNGLQRVDEMRDRVVACYAELRTKHPRVVLAGHSGGAYVATETAAYLERHHQARQLHTLLLFSLSPWYRPVYGKFLSVGYMDSDLCENYYDPGALGLTGPSLPKLSSRVVMYYGTEENFYMHWMAWEASRAWPNATLDIVPHAGHHISNIGHHFRREVNLEPRRRVIDIARFEPRPAWSPLLTEPELVIAAGCS